MTERIFFVAVGVFAYFVAYLVIGCGSTAIWKDWAWRTSGEFWEYNLNKGLELYYPGIWRFIKYKNLLYSTLYIALWPVMVPVKIALNNKVLRRLMSREYWY